MREIKQNSSILVYHFRCIGKKKHVLVALVKGSMLHCGLFQRLLFCSFDPHLTLVSML